MLDRKLLMLCYYFPPIQSAGCTRSVAFATNLPATGWKPTVLTVEKTRDPWVRTGAAVPAGIDIVRTGEWNLARVVDLADAVFGRLRRLVGFTGRTSWLRDLLCLPDTQIAWHSTLAGARLARSHDAIYASCSPFSSAVSGCLVKLLSGKPLVVDLRDAWTLNPHAKHTRIHRALVARLERLVFTLADRVVLNTEGATNAYRELYPFAADKLVAIPNGYDELRPVSAPPRDERFRILHLGSFYGSRQPDALMEALRGLRHLPIEFVQVGAGWSGPKTDPGVKVTLVDTLPRERALELLGTASLLYLTQGREPGVKRHIAVAAKTYEYLASGLPILADVPEGDNGDLVARYAAHAHVVRSGRACDLRAAIRAAYGRRHRVTPSVNEAFAAAFDRRHLTRRLARVLDEVVAERQPVIDFSPDLQTTFTSQV